MADLQNENASYERPADAGKPPRGIVTRWVKEIDLAGRVEEDWRKQGESVLKRFRDEAQLEKGAIPARKLGSKFNILRPNTRVMKAAIYQEPPKPDVRNRYKDRDPLSKAVSEVSERALSFNMDKYDIDTALQLAVNDMLLPGRGVTRVRYEPHVVPQTGPDGKPALGPDRKPLERIAWEKVCWRHVQWDDYRRGPGKTWDQVPWQAFRHRLTRAEAIKEIPEAKALLEKIDLDCTSPMTDEDEKAVRDNPDLADVFKRLTVWEIEDKISRQVLFIAPSHREQPLSVRDDPLGLEDFFSTPRPLYAVEQSDTLIPLEDFRAYADQAKELDNITARIDGIVSQLKVRGIYNAVLKQLAQVMEGDDGTLIPAEEVAAIANMGGLEDNIWLMPIEKIAAVLQYLYEHREQVKQTIYEITGLSDILRGQTKASETATAQSIKAQNGAISIQDRRKSVKRYARDLVRIAAEIICEHFQPETLKAMTGSDYPTEAEKQEIQAKLQALQQMQPQQAGGMPLIPPEQVEAMQERLALPSWEQIIAVMKDDRLRSYKIDIETDETAFGDLAAEQQAITELLSAVAQFLTAMAPLVQMGGVPPEFVKALLGTAVRRFRLGREIEDAIEALAEQQMQMPPAPDPNAGKIEAEKQANAEKMALERDRHEADMADREQARAFEREKHEFERQRHSDDMAMRERERQDAQLNATAERQSRETIAQAKAKPPVQMMFDKDGRTADLAEGTAGVAAAVQAMTETVRQIVASYAQAEARQTQAIGAMGQQIGAAIIAAFNTPKEVKRGKDGKITKVVPVQTAGAAPAGNGQVQ